MGLAHRVGIGCASILLASGAWAQATPSAYQLEPSANYMVGCFGGCTCPVVSAQSLGGSMDLTFIGSTPNWFDHYAVRNVDWVLVFGGQQIHVTGSGVYDIGGPVALMHRLRLDLSFDGATPRTFDSGLLTGGASFPRLDLLISLNGMVCYDEVFEVRASPLDVGTAYCTSTPNSTGMAAALAAAGSPSVANNDFSLVATQAPAGRLGLFFFGQGQQQTPFGDGYLCVSSAVHRVLPADVVDPAGAAWHALDLTSPPAAGLLVAGSTWNFQFWFRDPPGGPAGFNLTHGLQVGFL